MNTLDALATKKITLLQKALNRLRVCKEQLDEAEKLNKIGYPASIFDAEIALAKASNQLKILM